MGKRNAFDVMRFAEYSRWEIVRRTALIYANLMETGNNNARKVHRSEIYKSSDPSEKTATSYFLGLVATKLMLEKYLSALWLMHLDVYKASGHLNVLLQNKGINIERPDLVGLDKLSQWIVAEAKGRSGPLAGKELKNTFAKAKRQTMQISTINGVPPKYKLAVASHFATDKGDRLAIHWEDPEGDEEYAANLPLSKEDILREYYRPFIDLLRVRSSDWQRIEYSGQAYQLVTINEADISVGVNTRILNTQPYSSLLSTLVDVYSELNTNPNENVTIGHDGVIVQLGRRWNSNNMQQQPQDRLGLR